MMLVLRVLARQPLHGYAIAQRIHQLSADELPVEEGSLYPALQKLLLKGWVKAAWRESESGRQVREYRITASGRRQLEAEMTRVPADGARDRRAAGGGVRVDMAIIGEWFRRLGYLLRRGRHGGRVAPRDGGAPRGDGGPARPSATRCACATRRVMRGDGGGSTISCRTRASRCGRCGVVPASRSRRF